MPKYEVSMEVNRCSGYEVHGIEAKNEKEAIENIYKIGDFLRFEDLETYYDKSYGEPEPLEIYEVEKFEYDPGTAPKDEIPKCKTCTWFKETNEWVRPATKERGKEGECRIRRFPELDGDFKPTFDFEFCGDHTPKG